MPELHGFRRLDEEDPLPARQPSSTTVPGLVDEAARRWPSALFVQVWSPDRWIGSVQRITFADFAQRVAKAAAALLAADVRRGGTTAFLSHGSLAFYVHVFACMRLGNVPALLSWRQPVPTLARMAEVSGSTRLIASEHLANEAAGVAELLPSLGRPLVLEALEAPAALPAGVTLAPGGRALILFTSGSTSTPKAVPHTHAALLWVCASLMQAKGDALPPPPSEGGTLCLLPNFHAIVRRRACTRTITAAPSTDI